MSAADAQPRSGYVVTLGETMGLLFGSRPGQLIHGNELGFGIGGAESNVAIGLVRLGTPSVWVGRVGDDSVGLRVTRELRAEGVTVRATIDQRASTGLMLKEKLGADLSRIRYYRSGSAGSRLSPADLPEDIVAGAALLHVTGISLAISHSARSAVDRAVAIAREHGVPVSFDVNHRPSLWPSEDPVPIYRAIAAHASLLFAGEDEARHLVPGRTAPELAAGISALGPRHVVIKQGSKGAYALVDGVAHHADAIRVQVVDTVGAGDAFVAGYLAETLQGHAPAETLRTAVTAGAFACLGPGDWESLPRRSDLEFFERSEPVER